MAAEATTTFSSTWCEARSGDCESGALIETSRNYKLLYFMHAL